MSMGQIKIISDGNGFTTSILDYDDKPIQGVSRIEKVIEPDQLVKAVLTFDNVILSIVAEADLTQDEKQDGSD
jgi:hypothetical protein